MMRWTNLVIFVLLCLLIGWLYLWCYPAIQAIGLHHHSLSEALTQLLLAPQAATGLSGPLTIGFFAIGGAMMLVMMIDTRLRKRTTHGSARLANWRERQSFALPGRQPFAGLFVHLMRGMQPYRGPVPSLIVLGRANRQVVALSEKQQEEHLLLLSQTGGGKSSLIIIPSLLRELGSRSLYIADMKDELYRVCAGALAEHHEIWLFAPFRPHLSHGYNPLAHVHGVADAQDLAACWIRNTGEERGGDFWSKNSRMLMTAAILHLRGAEPLCAFSRLADLLTSTKFEQLQQVLENSPSPDARRAIGSFLSSVEANERLQSSVMADISNRFQALALREVRETTALNEIDFERMNEEHIAFFLSLDPDEADRLRPLIAALSMQMFATWRRKAKQSPTGALPHGMACYLDEFTNIGYIPKYASYISTARSMRVALLMACQSFAQLEELYGRQDATTIRTNSTTQLLLPGAGLEECKYFSERVGDTTIVSHSRSSRSGSDDTWSESETKRRLYTPDELRTLPERSLLMIRGRIPALMVRAMPYYEDRSLARRANLSIPARVRIYQEPPTTVSPRKGLSSGMVHPSSQTIPVVDAVIDAEEEDESLFFQPDE